MATNLPNRRRVLAAAALSSLVAGSATAAQPRAHDPAAVSDIAGIGLFTQASAARIAPDAEVVRTSGYMRTGSGAALYVLHRDPDATTMKPGRGVFRSADGRLFVLAETRPTPQMFGATGDGKTDDAPAFAELLAFARETTLSCLIPVGTYRLCAPLDVRGTHDGFPWHSIDFLGEQMDGVVLMFDYDGPYALRINDAQGVYSGMAGARIGCFTVMVAPGRRITQPVRVLNLLNGHCLDMRIRADWHRLDNAVELFRVSAATQWSRFTNILVDPYNAPQDGRPNTQRATGISIGHGYRDVPLQSSAISNNSFHDCTVNRCHIGFLSEAADATTTYNCRMVACHTSWIDRSSYATVHVNPWDEGATLCGFVFDSARVSDPNGTAVHKTQFPQIVGGYVGSVRLAGVVGADIRCALNQLDITADAERSRAVLLGQDSAQVSGEGQGCHVDRFDTTRHARVVSAGREPLIQQWPGGEFRLDGGQGGAPGNGLSVYGTAGPEGKHAGFREEVASDGSHLSYVWAADAIGHERRIPVKRTTPEAHHFATPLLPETDAQLTLGHADRRWRAIHLATSPVVTSDATTKRDVRAIPDAWLDAWADIRWVDYNPRDGEGDGHRREAGVIAQEIAATFTRHGIAAETLGLLETPRDGALWGVRYDQCHAIEAAWQRREFTRLAARLEMLEAQGRV